MLKKRHGTGATFLGRYLRLQCRFIREALHEVYIPRIQRGNASFAANVLGAGGTLLLVLVHFFEHGRWDSPVEKGVEGQSLTAEDQLYILTQAGLYLSVTRGLRSPEVRICYERAADEFIDAALAWFGDPDPRLGNGMGEGSKVGEARRTSLLIGACRSLAVTLYWLGDFDSARSSGTALRISSRRR